MAQARKMAKTITVLGATGKVGHVLVERLLAGGAAVRAIGRSADRLAPLAARGAEPHVGLAEDPRFLAEAFRRADAAFVLLPPDIGHPDPAARARALADAASAALQVARVPRAVTLSSIGADHSEGNGPIAGLHYLERRVNAIPGIHTLHLRAGYFYENLLAGIGLIRSAGINGGGLAPDVPVVMIASRDIGEVAASLLTNPTFTGQRSRELRGPRSYTSREATAILGAAIQRPDLAYVQFPEADVRAALLSAGFSPALADQYLEMIRGLNSGSIRALEPRSPANTTPTTLEEFAGSVFAPAFGQ
jgi:uncharacterized protein YbjT (DUF2867 family)